MPRATEKPRKNQKRKNPIGNLFGLDFMGLAADLSITAAVADCTNDEKIVIASIISALKPTLRKAGGVKKAAAKIKAKERLIVM